MTPCKARLLRGLICGWKCGLGSLCPSTGGQRGSLAVTAQGKAVGASKRILGETQTACLHCGFQTEVAHGVSEQYVERKKNGPTLVVTKPPGKTDAEWLRRDAPTIRAAGNAKGVSVLVSHLAPAPPGGKGHPCTSRAHTFRTTLQACSPDALDTPSLRPWAKCLRKCLETPSLRPWP